MVGHRDVVRIDRTVSKRSTTRLSLASSSARRARNSTVKRADHVWGYTIINDVTARDLQGRHSQWLIGKSQDTFCPMGPWAATKTVDLADTQIRCWVNGNSGRTFNTRDLIFDVPTIIATISAGVTLVPATSSRPAPWPASASASRRPNIWLPAMSLGLRLKELACWRTSSASFAHERRLLWQN